MGFTLFIEHLNTGTMAQRDALAGCEGDERDEPIHFYRRRNQKADRVSGGKCTRIQVMLFQPSTFTFEGKFW